MDATTKEPAALVAVVSTMLIVGALAFQAAGYAACELCMWQRWAHVAAAAFASTALILPHGPGRSALGAAILGIAVSGMIGGFHAGVEWKLWEGLATCSARMSSGSGDVLMDIMRAPLVRCDEAAWRLAGISMAGYNALISLAAAAAATTWAVRGSMRARQTAQ